jgi:outer membrane protein TolC
VINGGLNGLREGQKVHFDWAQTVSLEPAEAKKASFGETNAEILKIQLEQAEKELALTEQRYKAGMVPGEEFYTAQDKVAWLKAELGGDPVEIAKVNLAAAQRRMKNSEMLYREGMTGSSDYEAAKTEFAIAKAKWDEANAQSNKK